MSLFPYIFIVILSILNGNTYGEIIEAEDEVKRFDELLKEDNSLAILFTEPCCACTDCVEAEVLLGGMSKELEDNLGIYVVRLKSPELKKRYGVKRVPTLIYVRENKVAVYSGKFEFDTLNMWLLDNKQPATVDLNDSNFEHLTQAATGATTGDWLVVFHDESCCKKRELMHLETAGTNLKNKVNVADVNILKSPETKERFKINTCPEIIFFHHQRMYRFTLSDVTSKTLKKFAEGFYKNSKAEPVSLPPSSFDKILDSTIEFYSENRYALISIFAFTTLCTSIVLICSVIKPSPRTKSD